MSTQTRAKTAQITCITKVDRYDPAERISHVGGIGWKLTLDDAIARIERGEWQFYVHVKGQSVWVVVATSRFGNKYLKTQNDGHDENNLLSLPECP
jgi:hypothetical protein